MTRKFEPWKQERMRGVKIAAFALVSGAVAAGLVSMKIYEVAFVFGALSVLLAGASMSRFKSAANREFGKRFEEEFVERAARELLELGFTAELNIMARGIGDIDLVVYKDGSRIPVEVKSFRKWNQFFVFTGEREKRALIQSDRQRRALKSERGIVWVPQGRPTFLQRIFGAGSGNVSVVFGGERALVRVLKRLFA